MNITKRSPSKIIATLSPVRALTACLLIGGTLLLLFDHRPPPLSSASSQIVNTHDGHSRRRLGDGLGQFFGNPGLVIDPKSITPRTTSSSLVLSTGNIPKSIPVTETSHEQDTICIAKVDDGNIITASVLDESGNFDLSLPKDYEASTNVACTDYERIQSAAKDKDELRVFGQESAVIRTRHAPLEIIKQSDGQHEPQICNPKSFRPGYFDTQTKMWHDHCTGRIFDTDEAKARSESPFLENNCPFVARKKKEPIWISFVGDSVTREMFQEGLFENGADMPHVRLGQLKFNGKQDVLLAKDMASSSQGQEVWLSFVMFFIHHTELGDNIPEEIPYGLAGGTHGERAGKIPYTWGDFVEQRGLRPQPDDPNFPNSKVPDIILFSPGYHASHLSSAAYGSITERVLSHWKDELEANYNAPMPPVHIMLNMMPATWKIPGKYYFDRTYRTLLNEYRKNLAIMAAANKFDFVKSTIDFFSVELPFNWRRVGLLDCSLGLKTCWTAHRDAVHMGDTTVIRIIGDRALEAICNSE